MLRLNQADFEDPHELAKLAATSKLSINDFKNEFYYLIENDLLYKNLEEGKILLATSDSNSVYNVPNNIIPDPNHIDDIGGPRIIPE